MTVIDKTSTQPTAITFKRSMSTFVADCVVEERHDDSWVITDHPVEQGTTVSDHVYKLPARVTLTYVWSLLSRVSITSPNNAANSASFLRDLYNQLLQVQANASGVVTPFSVYTGKRYYPNMLLENLMVTTDKNTENVLSIRATCKELIMVTTQTANNPMFALQSLQNPNNAPPVDLGNMILLPGQNFSMTGGS